MTKMRMLSIPIVLIVVALMIPAITEAGSLKIWPDQLKPISVSSYEQTVFYVCNGTFTAPFTLPVGARITKITYYHFGETGPAATSFGILRVKMGNATEILAAGSSTDATAAIIPVDVPITGDPIIRAGYRYYIKVVSDNANSDFLGVKITYRE